MHHFVLLDMTIFVVTYLTRFFSEEIKMGFCQIYLHPVVVVKK